MQITVATKKGLNILDKLPTKLPKENIWIHITKPSEMELFNIKQLFNIHPLTIEDIANENARLKVETFAKYTFTIFSQIHQKKNSICYTPLYFILGKNYLISFSQHDLIEIPQTAKELLFKKGIDWVFHRVLDQEVDAYFPIMEELEEQVNHLEKLAFNKDKTLSANIILLRKKVAMMKHQTMLMQEKISSLIKNQETHVSIELEPYLRDILDHTNHLSDMSENLRDTIRASYEIYTSEVSKESNDVMKVFSIIATLMLPLTVISGIYGTNFKNLPGMYNHNGFWLMLAGMFALMVIMIAFFKKKKWF